MLGCGCGVCANQARFPLIVIIAMAQSTAHSPTEGPQEAFLRYHGCVAAAACSRVHRGVSKGCIHTHIKAREHECVCLRIVFDDPGQGTTDAINARLRQCA